MKSELNADRRYEAEFFKKRFLREESALKKHRLRQIGEFANVTDGPHGYHVVDENSPVVMLTAKNAKGWFTTRENADPIAEWVDTANRRSSLKENDIILSTRGTVGMCALVTEEVLPANIDQDVARISWESDEILPGFLLAYLNSSFGQDHIQRYASGMVQQGMSLQKVREIPVPELSNEFQERVEMVVCHSLMIRREAKAATEQAESLLLSEVGLDYWQPSEALTYERSSKDVFGSGRLDAEYFQPSKTLVLDAVKDSGAVQLSDISLVGTGFPWKSEFFIEDSLEPGLPFIRIRDCKPDFININSLDKLLASYALSQNQPKTIDGDIVVGMDGIKYFYASQAPVDTYINQRVGHIRLFNQDYTSEYIITVINSILGQRQLMRDMTIANTVGHITLENMRQLWIPNLDSAKREAITQCVQDSSKAKRLSLLLLNSAKRAVEIAIEESEAAALAYLEFSGDS